MANLERVIYICCHKYAKKTYRKLCKGAMDTNKNIIVKHIENLYVHNRTGKLWNMIRHVKSHTNSSVTDISLSSLEEYYKKTFSDTNAKGSYIQQCTSAVMSKYSKIENLVMDKVYYTEERLTRFIKSLKSGCSGGS